jgi:hypothetical protein
MGSIFRETFKAITDPSGVANANRAVSGEAKEKVSILNPMTRIAILVTHWYNHQLVPKATKLFALSTSS